MNVKHFSKPQNDALLDLALLAMYADGHLAFAEDDRVHRLLTAMGVEGESPRAQAYDAAVTRVRRHAQSAAAARAHAMNLAGNFTQPEHRREVVSVLDDLLSSDSRLAPQESGYLAVVKEAFGM